MAWRRAGTLHWALGLSLAVHGALLALRFIDPAGADRIFRDSPLEVILVNAHTAEAPAKALALAQAALAGGGDLASGRATSPLPATAQVDMGNASDEAQRRVNQLQDQQQQLLAQIRREMALLPPPDPKLDAGTPQARDTEERRRQLLKLLAEIEKRINHDSAQPRRRYISPATQEVPYALYYDRLRRRIEDRGTRNFPEHLGKKLYGELTLNITVDASGRLVDADVVRGSGSNRLDASALAILRSAAPFDGFSAAMRQEADQIILTSRFRFTRDDGLEATLSDVPR